MAEHTRRNARPALLGGYVTYPTLVVGTTVLTWIVMMLGSYTGAIGAGLSCPDWPTCYGVLVPWFHPQVVADSPYTALQIFAEWFHRGMAMVAGILIVGVAIAAWRLYRDRPAVVWPAVLAVVLLPFQVVLGGLTVTEDLAPLIVTAHLGTATALLVMLGVSATAATLVHRGSVRP
ncbi:MAG: heme A synthase [Halanaeroarchaeum sp.]